MASLRKRMFPSGKVRWQVDYRDGRHRQFTTKREAEFLAAESEGRSARRSSYPGNPSRSTYARLLISGFHGANATDWSIMIEPN